MKIIKAPIESRRVAKKLQAFIDNAIEMTEQKMTENLSPEGMDFLSEMVRKTEKIQEKSRGEKPETMLAYPANLEQFRILTEYQKWLNFKRLNQSVLEYSEGRSVKDILLDARSAGKQTLGIKGLQESAPLAFSDKKVDLVITKTENAANVTERRAWKELGELVTVYHKAMNKVFEGVGSDMGQQVYFCDDAIRQISSQIQNEHDALYNRRSFDAPVKGIDYIPL